MANQQLELLKKGSDVWNKWRTKHQNVKPDISGASRNKLDLIKGLTAAQICDLSEANLSEANLSEANLSFSDLRNANLSLSDLRNANLSEADLGHANLIGTNLSGANLSIAELEDTDLSNANLSNANLYNASLCYTDLSNANLYNANLSLADLSNANLHNANLGHTNLSKADLTDATFSNTNFNGAIFNITNLSGVAFSRATFTNTNLSEANFNGTNLSNTTFSGANLTNTNLSGANLTNTNLSGANLTNANLSGADLTNANLSGADLTNANLSGARLVGTNLTRGILTRCTVYGISVWNVQLEGAKQENIVITNDNESTITVDNLEVAQFIYLLLNNTKIRDIINTITTKVVLILGRFTPDRKLVLDALRETLRQRNYLPVLFDFEKPNSRNFTETVSTLAHLARFIIADLTSPRSIPQELQAIIPLLHVPVQPLLHTSEETYSMFEDLEDGYHWVLPPYRYPTLEALLTSLKMNVIEPAERKAQELEKR